MPSLRLRRLFLILLALPVLFLLSLCLNSPSGRSISDLFSTRPSNLPDEIFGLLHFVTSPDEADRVLGTPDAPGVVAQPNENNQTPQFGSAILPSEPVDLAWYALGSIAKTGERTRPRGQGRSTTTGWDDRLQILRQEYPLVVFSKSYCPYSRRAKRLLEMYDISPPPKIIEVDLRADSASMKTLLTRLTHRSTFPNVILDGRSLGGSDDLMRLHQEDRLRQILMAAGVTVRWTGEGGRGDFF